LRFRFALTLSLALAGCGTEPTLRAASAPGQQVARGGKAAQTATPGISLAAASGTSQAGAARTSPATASRTSPAAASRTAPATASGVSPAAAAGTSVSAGAPSPADPAQALRGKLVAAMGQLRTFAGTVATSEIDWQGRPQFASMAFRTDVVRRWIRGTQVRAFRPDLSGSELLFLNDRRVTLQLTVGSVTVTRSFPYEDEHVVSPRRLRIDQTDFTAMVGAVLTPDARLRYQGLATIDGKAVEVLDVWPSRVPGAASERVGLDPATFLPVTRQVFASSLGGGQGEFLRQVIDGAAVNPPLPPETWRL